MTQALPTPDAPLNIGTRGSPLALAQAHETRARLAAAHGLSEDAFRIVVIHTTGDDRTLIDADRALKEIGNKGLFTKEIEEAMLRGDIDIAVHSSKDMPVEQPQGLVLDCFLPREDVRDAFVSLNHGSIADLPEGAEGVHVGNPVRRAVLDRAGAAYIPPGDYPMSILVMGGSQGARILSDMVPAAVAALPEGLRRNVRVSHQARAEDHDRVASFYAEHGIDADVQPFFNDVPNRMAEAQLVISRSGASSVADISVIGRPSILIPYAAAAGDHQTANARGLVEAGAAIRIPESALSPEALTDNIATILTQPDGAIQMARAAFSVSAPDATDRLVAVVEDLAMPQQEDSP